jgi:ferric iron reductase protein FhuF
MAASAYRFKDRQRLDLSTDLRSPVVEIYVALRAFNASWSVEVGRPSGMGWIAGDDLRAASKGPFNDLLRRIGESAGTADRRTIAASFALRYGWSSAMAIAPFLKYSCVPDVSLENISLKFHETGFFERTAIHQARGVMVANDPRANHPAITVVADRYQLLRSLRSALMTQAIPVVEALYDWSGFARRGTWGMLTSSWAAHVINLIEDGRDQRQALPVLHAFFAGDDLVATMQPKLHALTHLGVTHLYQRRASCCRIYLLPQMELCASCPLVSHEERLARNLEWMKTQLEYQGYGRRRT